ncbi:MAG: type IA DNA topoisomerase [Candidatus Kapaibacteriota bacterium]
MKRLVIVESFTKTNTIKKYLNDKNVIVTYSSGHIYNLPKDKLGFDTNTWALDYIKTNPKVISNIRECVVKTDIIYIATDPDLEGETIAYNIKDSIADLIKNKKCYRISFNEITETAVKAAISNPREIDLNIVNAQETRRIVDRMIGYKVSPILWSKFNKNYLSSGRVQNAALIMCINQRNKILNSEILQRWNIECKFIFDKKDKKSSLVGSLINHDNIDTAEIARSIMEKLKTNVKYSIKYDVKNHTVSPPPPYTTTSMQQDCYNKYKWNAKITMKYAQDLYENGLISYIRTDSVIISNDAKNIIINYIKNTYDACAGAGEGKYAKYRSFKSKINNAQEAHEAIRITNPNIIYCNGTGQGTGTGAGTGTGSLSANHDKLYDMIRKRTLASLMSDAIYTDIVMLMTSSLSENKEYLFKSTKSFMTFEGFKIVYGEKTEDYEEFTKMLDNNPVCYSYEYKSNGFIDNIPSLYNEVQLIKQLEKEGIGRPSTYASIIDKLLEKKYVEIGKNPQQEYNITSFIKKNKRDDIIIENKKINLGGNSKDLLIPTELGINVIEYIFDVMPYLCDLKFTSKMENDLDDIINMKNNKKNILDDIYSKISKSLQALPASSSGAGSGGQKNKTEYKDGFITTRYGPCYYNKSSNSYTNIDSYLKWKKKAFDDLNDADLAFISSLPKAVIHSGKPFKLHMGRYGLYLKDDKCVNHKLEKKLWSSFI